MAQNAMTSGGRTMGLTAALVALVLSLPVEARAAGPCEGTYTVRSGDTLGRIAQRCGTTVNEILAATPGLNPRRLRIGQEVTIPVAETETARAAPARVTEAPPAPTGAPVELSGTIETGRYCALLRTPDGTLYGLRSATELFVSGRDVRVTGRIAEADLCGPARSIHVGQMAPGEL